MSSDAVTSAVVGGLCFGLGATIGKDHVIAVWIGVFLSIILVSCIDSWWS